VNQIVGAGVFGPAAGSASFNTIRTGWTLGGGVETSLAWLGMSNRWSTKFEYLYVDLGSVTDVARRLAAGDFRQSSTAATDLGEGQRAGAPESGPNAGLWPSADQRQSGYKVRFQGGQTNATRKCFLSDSQGRLPRA
jgi:hypothetical protein